MKFKKSICIAIVIALAVLAFVVLSEGSLRAIVVDVFSSFYLFFVFIVLGLIGLVYPVLTVIGTVIWLFFFLSNVWTREKRKQFQFKRKRWWLTACVLVFFNALLIPEVLKNHDDLMSMHQQDLWDKNLDTVLTKDDIDYQGLLVPAGSIVKCLGYDYGKPRFIAENELCAARFSRPVTVKGVEFIAIEPEVARPSYGQVELASDQIIRGEFFGKRSLVCYASTKKGPNSNQIEIDDWEFKPCGGDEKPIELAVTPPPPRPGYWAAFLRTLTHRGGGGFYCC